MCALIRRMHIIHRHVYLNSEDVKMCALMESMQIIHGYVCLNGEYADYTRVYVP